jgi:mRNA interferase RelE/StbE
LAWTIEVESPARKQFRKLGKTTAARIIAGLEQIAAFDNPRQRGKALTGKLAGFWRWRFGDYRVIGRIEDEVLVIVVVAVGDRREVYD